MPYGITKPSPKPTWANSAAGSDLYEPSDSVKAAGWTATNPCPPYQWENWLHKYVTTAVRYLMGTGVSAYDPDETYTVGDIVKYGTPSITYQCKVQPLSSGILPTNTDYWEVYGTSWLPDALKTALAESLPVLMAAAMMTQLGITAHSYTSPRRGYFTCGMFQICYALLTLDDDGSSAHFPENTALTWATPFMSVFGAVAMPQEANCTMYINSINVDGCTVGVQSQPTNPPYPCHAFVIALGIPVQS